MELLLCSNTGSTTGNVLDFHWTVSDWAICQDVSLTQFIYNMSVSVGGVCLGKMVKKKIFVLDDWCLRQRAFQDEK